MELAIVKHIKEHGLAKTLNKFKLKCKDYGHKIIIKYDMIDTPLQYDEAQDARGLVLEKDTWKVMSLAFRKFFNAAEEKAAKIDWDTAQILEKLDGSMIQVYFDWVKGEWFAGTTGTAEAEGEVNNKLGSTFADLFWDTFFKYCDSELHLDEDIIYIFELTTPYNIVVKPHGESSVTLLSARWRDTLNELTSDRVAKVADTLGVPVVKVYDINATNTGHLLKTFDNMPYTEEGYVVVDKDFNRIKVKNPAYVAVHHLKDKTSEYKIMVIVKSNEVDEFAATFPERKDELYTLKENYDKLNHQLHDTWETLKNRLPKDISPAERKRFAQEVFKVAEEKDVEQFASLFFALLDGKAETVSEYLHDYSDKKLYEML